MLMETARIRLRSWQKDDLSDFCALNADPDVMRFFPATLARKDSDNLAASFQAGMLRHGFGIWVLELPGISSFAGVVGLNVPSFDNTLVEVSWRLHKLFWGHGFATEASAVALEAGFSLFSLESICSVTARLNIPSEKVMRRLGMEHNPKDDFHHPALPDGHPLSRHVFYRMRKQRWKEQKKKFPFLEHLHIVP